MDIPPCAPSDTAGAGGPAFDDAVHWTIALYDAVCGQGELDTLLPRFREWLVAVPENRPTFAEVWNLWNNLDEPLRRKRD